MDKSIRKTGGQVDDLVLALIDAAYDKKVEVRNDIARALHQLGKKEAELVLSTCSLYLTKHQKLVSGHRVALFEIMKNIIKDAGDLVPIDLAKELILLASTELTKSKDVEPDWQMAPSLLLVGLGARFSDDVMGELLSKLEPGSLPHYFTVLTLANLATENVYGVVPFMKDIFSRMMLMVGMAKADNMRWVFAHCIGCFSEAILDYCANIDNAPYPDISKDRFYGEIFSAYEIMFNVWMQSREAKLRLAIVKALGHMSHLMAKDKLEEQLQRLMHGVTALYRKHSEHYIITQGLCMILDAATSDGSQMLLPLLDQLLNGLHNQACVEPDYSNIQTVKNHNEILRCFQVLNRAFSDRVVTFLQLKLENGNEKSKVATLTILKHLINSSGDSLENKKEIILAGLTVLLQEPSLKIRKALAQVVIAMAHRGYLELDGGEKMVEFIVRQCAISENERGTKKAGEDDFTPGTVKSMCENILHLMTTTVEIMEDVLWPKLMEFLIPVHYTEGVMAMCKSLAYLASKKRESETEDYQINYSQQVNVPKPQALISRLLVMAGHPQRGSGRGLHVLKFMKAMSPNLHPDLVDLWDTVIPRLIQYLEDHTSDQEEWNQKSWEDFILKLLAKTLGQIDSEEWFLALGREMGQQISLYGQLPEEKNFLFKCLGVVLRRIGTTDFIREHLNLIFNTVDHSSQVEREGCAVGVGFCAASHLDQCLVKLEEITKTQMVRKSTGFMGLLKDKSEGDVERIKSTVMLCYGYVVFYGPPGLVVSRLETNVLRVISPHLSSSKDAQVKLNLTRAVDLIGKAVQPSHLLQSDFIFTRRGDLLKHMQAFLMSESKTSNNETKALAIDATTNLVKLEPKLPETELQDILKVCTESVYPTLLVKQGDVKEIEASERALKQALESLNNLLKEICSKDPTPSGLLTIWKLLEPYIVSPSDQERERGIQSVKVVYQFYVQSVASNTDSHFSTLGNLVGRALPRCTDPVMSVRQHAIECIQILLTINDRYEGVPSNVNDERIEALSRLKDVLKTDDPSILFNVVNELSVVINKKTPDEQLKNLVNSLIDGLKDQHSQSSSGACVMLNCIMKSRGAELSGEINKIVVDIHNGLITVTFQPTITGSIVAMRTLASHHLIPVLSSFLNFPVPFSPIVRDFWQTLAKDKDLTQDTFDHLLDLLMRSAPFSEKEDPRDKKAIIRIATSLPIAVTCAITEMCRVSESESLVVALFAKLFSAVLLRMGSCLGVKPPQVSPDQKGKKKDSLIVPMTLALECFKEVLGRSNCSKFKPYMEEKEGWALLEDEKTFTDGLEIVAVGLCECAPKYISDIVSCLVPALTSSYDNQRIVPTAIFAELINQRCKGDMQLVEILMNSLLSKLVDPSHTVRRLCIRGLGNVANVGGHKLQTYSTTILSAMMAGMDDKEDPENSITLEAMSGLSRILNELDESSIRQILINICLRIRPCFEKEHDDVRAAAISLFGNLARFGFGPSESAFVEQVHTNFVSILLHLNEEPAVTKACKVALRQLGPRLQSTAINGMFQKHLIEGGQLHYGEFMNDLSRLIIADYPSKVNFYVMSCVGFFKSSWSDIRANAAIFVGFLLGNLKTEQREEISTEHVCGALIMLLKDISAKVRSNAAEAISLLHDY